MLLQNYQHLQYSWLFNEDFSNWHYTASNNGKNELTKTGKNIKIK